MDRSYRAPMVQAPGRGESRRLWPSVWPWAFASIVTAVLAVGACVGPETRVVGPITLAIVPTTRPALEVEGERVWQVTRSVGLPLRAAPAELSTEGSAPYPRKVWFTPNDVRVQASYVLSNLDDHEIEVELLIDGWNEFVHYAPGIYLTPGQLLLERSAIDRLVTIPARGRVAGRISWDDFERMAVALALLMNGPPNAQHLMQPEVDLQTSPLSRPYMPSVIDGLTGFDVSLRARTSARVATELMVEILDAGEHLAPLADNTARERPEQAVTPRSPRL